MKYLEKTGKKGMISSPCPAIVSYVEKYRTELIDALIPVYSPVMCMAKYLRKYEGNRDKIAFLSPCIAKKSELNVKTLFHTTLPSIILLSTLVMLIRRQVSTTMNLSTVLEAYIRCREV